MGNVKTVQIFITFVLIFAGLYERWWDVCACWRKITDRIAAVGFVMEFTKQPESFLFVTTESNINSVDDIRTGSSTIGELSYLNFHFPFHYCSDMNYSRNNFHLNVRENDMIYYSVTAKCDYSDYIFNPFY